jgi:hypothetical protein
MEQDINSSGEPSKGLGIQTSTPVDIPGVNNGGTGGEFTSFPEEEFVESPRDPRTLSNFYTKMKSLTSVATNAVQSVLPGVGGRSEASGGSTTPSVRGSKTSSMASASLKSTPLSVSPLRYLQTGEPPASHKAPPKANVTMWSDSDDIRSVGTQSFSSAELSRSVSSATMYSYNPRSHLPGYAIEQDDASDTESVMSSNRDFIISQLSKRIEPFKGGLDKEFWMKDENATECFRCGRPFTSKCSYI